MKLNDAGLNLIKSFEGLRLTAYQDQGGIWTIGYGHTGSVASGDIIDEIKAESLLQQDLKYTEALVTTFLLSDNINDNQFSALVSFTYNVGVGAFKTSHLLKYVNSGNMDLAANEFLKWDHVNGKEDKGLLRRRTAERALFLEII